MDAPNTGDGEFLYYDEAVKIRHHWFDHTFDPGVDDSKYAVRLSGGTTNEIYGLTKSLSVMPGDTINAEVYAKFIDSESANWTQAFSDLVTLISQHNSSIFIDGGLPGSIGNQTFPLEGMVAQSGGSGPKASLNWIIFDRNMLPLDMGNARLSDIAKENGQNVAHERLATQIAITEPGYVYLYLSNENETPVEVYFDDFKVSHVKSPVVQMDDYYPFGLQFNHYQRENSHPNKYLFNGGSELQTDLDLGFYFTLFRMYDPAIGRFMQIDPLADFFSGINPYNFAENNPVLYGDPSGLSPNIWQRVKAFFGIGRLSGDKVARNLEYEKPVRGSKHKKTRSTETTHTPSPKDNTRYPDDDGSFDVSTRVPKFKVEIPEPEIPDPLPNSKPASKPTSKSTVKRELKPSNSITEKETDPRSIPPFDVPRGGTHQFDAYQFETDKADLYHTPANDKLINDLIITLKNSSGMHLEIQGNINAEPDNALEQFLYPGRQQRLMSGRAQAIYNALRAAGIPASQLKASPGNTGRTGANMSATFILKNK
jgi:RHS repeat-associated protein